MTAPFVTPASKRIPIGLALGGGVARGWAHIGVIDALREAGLEPDVIAGASIGALVGGAYAAGHLDSLRAWALGLTRRSLLSYLDVRLRGGGVLAGERLAKRMDEQLGDVRIEDLERPFVAVCAELATGHEAWLRSGPLTPALRASYALPGAFAPVLHEGRYLIDGALVNPVPVSVCRALGARLVIAVGLHGDAFGSVIGAPDPGAPPEPAGAVDAALTALTLNKPRPERVVMRQLFGADTKSPRLGSVMLGALNLVMDRLGRSRLAGDPPDVYVIPKVAHIGLLEFTKAEELIGHGREAMTREMPVLKHAVEVLSASVHS